MSNTFEIEWLPKSQTLRSFPEIDKAQWFAVNEGIGKNQQGNGGSYFTTDREGGTLKQKCTEVRTQ